MECRHCGKKGLANIQAIRAHLRFCPNRPEKDDGQQEPHQGKPTYQGEKHPRADLGQVPQGPITWAAEFEIVGVNLGIHPRTARIVVNYLGYVCDPDDPLSLWRELADCKEIRFSLRCRWVRTWCNLGGVPLAPWQEVAMGWG